ncbi:hypothetical protein SS1G_10780 [Sclerotinia sclerotiorum 1980 UF-70]|uniref:C3H1-type domain-containing protein n=2 Tax=Sclerotinia sclerotiorum (strain ATCC 18683 / 1980 / Ss-1) TaxID=665079 RepID=A7EZL3_SCLS1|nr:hypothetical protein SS1G_10780 [Sclerotinia sclerotiorum 1980 UF-70]APA12225.1 hypothetical protein sscle_09g069950 [Sclerotinia sclerotiorum 1980 UF-70]EDN94905.1 hypothetical protein SS1G_10780 [Sclerotinia sclerotiorum 1980 UF-70]
MSTQVKICSNIKLSDSPESSHALDNIDTEMSSPLTSIDNDSDRSFTPEKMDAFHLAREREERIRRNGQTPSHTPTPPMVMNNNGSAWRRQSLCDPAYASPEGFTPLTVVRPGPVYPLPEQINSAFAYGIRRADGSYTRLLPADELPAINGIPRRQGPEGLIIVPELQHGSPKPEHATPMIPNKVVAKLPPLAPPMFGLNQQSDFRRPGDQTQLAIDSIVASAVAPPMSVPPAKNAMVPMGGRTGVKIYCDKWVHEGTCAFTQVGCKFKHEMPMDKATQLLVGLNHGLPNWYRNQQNASASSGSGTAQIEASGTTPTNGTSRTSQSWRRKEATSFSLPTSAQGGTNGRDRRSSFGPIGPPHARRLTNSSSGDSINRTHLSVPENGEENDNDVKMQWNGRARGYTNGQEQDRRQQ